MVKNGAKKAVNSAFFWAVRWAAEGAVRRAVESDVFNVVTLRAASRVPRAVYRALDDPPLIQPSKTS